jgi:uncharacterized glyoxalase superfamily protein PhnB
VGDAIEQRILGVAPYIVVDDLVAAANWYRDALGFKYRQFWGEPPSFTMVSRDGVVIMLKEVWGVKGKVRPNRLVHENACWDMYLWVKDARALYAEFQAKGVKIVREIEDTFYGCRDFDIEDCNGYVLCFGQDLEG